MRLFANILVTGLIAGTLDILAAIFILAGGNAGGVFRYIASGVFGKSAFDGGGEMAVYGLLIHYIIAISWAALFFLIYPKLLFLKRSKWLNAIVYGAFVWAIMNLVVLPFTQIAPRIMTASDIVINIVILMVCIGLPVSILAERYYSRQQETRNSG